MNRLIPLDEEWNHASARKTAVFGDGEPPPQVAPAHGRDNPKGHGAPVRKLLDAVGPDRPGKEQGLSPEPFLHRFAVQFKPSRTRRFRGAGIDGDHFQVAALPQPEHPVMGPLGGVFAPIQRPDAQGAENMLGTFLQISRRNNQMVNLRFHRFHFVVTTEKSPTVIIEISPTPGLCHL